MGRLMSIIERYYYTNTMNYECHFQSSFSIVIDLNLNVICTYPKTKGQFELVWV